MSDDATASAASTELAETKRRQQMVGFTALPLGTRLDHFVIDTVLGAGGFGITYLAQHDALKKPFALKEYFPRDFAYRDGLTVRSTQTEAKTFSWGLSRFLDEARALAKFKHPAIVDVAHVFEANGTAYMALAYEQGRTFGSWLRDLGRPPTQAELDGLVTPLLDAMTTMHGAGMLHRDIAPDNILVRDDGTPVLLDFGSARSDLQERAGPVTAIVKTGKSPPEQYKTDGSNQGPWSDIYAFAATLYQATTGRPPMDAMERMATPERMPSAQAMPQSQMRGFRAPFLAAIDWGMRLEPKDRPQSITAWRMQLMADDAPTVVIADSPPLLEPAQPPMLDPWWKTRATSRIGMGALAIVAVAIVYAAIPKRPAGDLPVAPIEVTVKLPKAIFAVGDPFSFTLRANRDCNLTVFTIDADDKVELHDPNVDGAFMGSPVLKAGEVRQIPVPGAPGQAIVKPRPGVYQLGAVCARQDLVKLGLSAAQLRAPAASGKRSFTFKLDEIVQHINRDEVSRVTVGYEVR